MRTVLKTDDRAVLAGLSRISRVPDRAVVGVTVAAALAAVVLVVAGCGQVEPEGRPAPPDNSAEICADVRAVDERYVAGATPEGRAYHDAMRAAYTGASGAADVAGLRRRYFDAWAGELRSLAGQARGERLRTVLLSYIDVLGRGAVDGTGTTSTELVRAQKELDGVCASG